MRTSSVNLLQEERGRLTDMRLGSKLLLLGHRLQMISQSRKIPRRQRRRRRTTKFGQLFVALGLFQLTSKLLQRIKRLEIATFRPLVRFSSGIGGCGTFLNFSASSHLSGLSTLFSISCESCQPFRVVAVIILQCKKCRCYLVVEVREHVLRISCIHYNSVFISCSKCFWREFK